MAENINKNIVLQDELYIILTVEISVDNSVDKCAVCLKTGSGTSQRVPKPK